MSKCPECGSYEDVKLINGIPLCVWCRQEVKIENERINHEDLYKEDRRLEVGRGPLRV